MNKFLEFINNMPTDSSIKNVSFVIDEYNCILCYQESLAKVNDFNQYFVTNINKENINCLHKTFPGTFTLANEATSFYYSDSIASGYILLFINEENLVYKIALKNMPSRAISESTIDSENFYGAKDGLVEEKDKNIALIQKRIKNEDLIIDNSTIGSINPTNISILYLKNMAKSNTIKEIKEKLDQIEVSSLSSTNDIIEVFNKKYLFPTVAQTSAPENVLKSLYKGRVVILIDQLPVALILPVNLGYFINIPQETNAPIYYSLYQKSIISLMIFFSVFFLGIYVAIVNYHAENLSLIMISEVKVTARGTTIPLFIEIISILTIFEILKIASSVTPSSSLQNVIVIVGGLLIGQNTVSSGFIGAFNLVLTSICFLSTYGITNNQHLITSLSIARLFILISSILLGMYGFIISSIIFIIYLANIKSLDEAYLSPVVPFNIKSFLRLFIPRKYFTEEKNEKII